MVFTRFEKSRISPFFRQISLLSKFAHGTYRPRRDSLYSTCKREKWGKLFTFPWFFCMIHVTFFELIHIQLVKMLPVYTCFSNSAGSLLRWAIGKSDQEIISWFVSDGDVQDRHGRCAERPIIHPASPPSSTEWASYTTSFYAMNMVSELLPLRIRKEEGTSISCGEDGMQLCEQFLPQRVFVRIGRLVMKSCF